MKKILLSTALLSSLAATHSSAEGPSFSYVEGGYSDIEESNGYIIRGAAELTENIYFSGSYNDVTLEESGFTDIDNRFAMIGVGYKTLISDNTAFFTELNYIDQEFKAGSFSDSEDGHNAALGLRSMVTDNTELYGKITNEKIDITTTALTIGARQYFTDNFGVFAEVGRNDYKVDLYNIGVSYRF